MPIKRRDLIKTLPLAALMPWQFLSVITDHNSLNNRSASIQLQDIDQIYKQAVVIDGLLIPRGWNENSFKALAKSGYTGFNASLVSRNLKLALASMAEWTKRIADNPDKLLHAKTADDFVRAKKEKKWL